MINQICTNPEEFMGWTWAQIEPFYDELEVEPISAENVVEWMKCWSHLAGLVYETYQRLYVQVTCHTSDVQARNRYDRFLDSIFVHTEVAEQRLKEKLLASGLQPAGLEIPLRNMRAEAEIFSENNLPLLAKELKLSAEYDRIIGEQVVGWQGREITLLHLQSVWRDPNRQEREQAWRLFARRWLQDRETINDLWKKLLDVRIRQAQNAGLTDYRAYRWKKMLRFAYTPEDCFEFHRAIEKVAVPAARLLYERRREKLGLDRVRPWDLNVDPTGKLALRPFESVKGLQEGAARIFRRVDPQLGQYFEIMRQEGLLDMDNRQGKAPGGYCTDFPVSGRPFIMMNAVGLHEDVQTILHEGGHAFHVFEIRDLPYFQQKRIGLEFMEVASTSMELLGAPYLPREQGGFYSEADAARARIEFLEEAIRYWPYMAVVDAFQHWVYENPNLAKDPANCDAFWGELWDRFMPGVDWSLLEDERMTGWQRKLHIFEDPFYYIEYGLSQLGAFQIWRNALEDQASAVRAYRKALSLGGTVPLSELYAVAGARFAFDEDTLREAVDLGMATIERLEQYLDE